MATIMKLKANKHNPRLYIGEVKLLNDIFLSDDLGYETLLKEIIFNNCVWNY